MSAPFPSEDPTFGALHVGNVHDDDGQVIDNLFIETDAPPDLVVQAIDDMPLTVPVPTTVLRTTTVNVDPTWTAHKVFVADKNRTVLKLGGYSSAATPGINDYAIIAYDQGLLTPTSGVKLRHNRTLDLDGHTGDIWVLSSPTLTASSTFEITVVAVTL